MKHKALVPVTRHVTVPSHDAAGAVQRLAGPHPVIQVRQDHEHPYQPGDPMVSAYVTTLEPPRRQHPWHLYLLGVAALVIALALAYAVWVDVYLVAGCFILAAFLALAWIFDRNDRRNRSTTP